MDTSSNTLETLIKYANEQIELENAIQEATTALKALSDKHRVLSEQTVPQLLHEVGISSLTSEKYGKTISIKEDLFASIKDSDIVEAHNWLRANGLGYAIKTNVVTAFNVGEEERANQVLTSLIEQGLTVTLKSAVHGGTLKKLIRENLEGEGDIPQSLFGVYIKEKSVAK